METWKRGDINPETGMIFSHTKPNGKLQWYSVEAWNRKKESLKAYNKKDSSKEYQKEWYAKNKLGLIDKGIKAREKRKETSPLKMLHTSIRNGAIKRDIPFEIDLDFITNKWDEQKGKCYYTNVSMKYLAQRKDPFQVSIDRIDSSLGYTKDNTVLCCQCINYMKNDYLIEDFKLFLTEMLEGLKLIV